MIIPVFGRLSVRQQHLFTYSSGEEAPAANNSSDGIAVRVQPIVEL